MTDLPISGMLEATVDQASLRAAQQEIEDELGDLSVGVDARAGGGGGRSGNVQGREQAMARRLASEGNEIAESQLEELEIIYEKVDEIADSQGGGLIGGDGGILGMLTEVGGDAAGEVGGAGALTGAAASLTGAASALTGAAAALTGSAAVDGLSEIIDGLTGDGDSARSVKKPEWVPMEVEDVGVLEVDEPTLSVDDPSPLEVNDPSPLSVVDDPLPVDSEPLPVESIDPIEISVGFSSGTQGGPQAPTPTPSPTASTPPENSGPGFFEAVGMGATGGITAGATAGAGVGAVGGFGIGAVPGAAIGAGGGALLGAGGGALGYAGSQLLGDNPGRGKSPVNPSQPGRSQPSRRSDSPQQNTTVNVTVEQQTEISADGKKIRRDIMRDTEAMIDDLQRQLDRLERDITGGR